MKAKNYQIFRADAVRRYLQHQQKSVRPPFLQPRVLVWLWILLALSLIAGVMIIRLLPAGLLGAEVQTRWALAEARSSALPALLNEPKKESR